MEWTVFSHLPNSPVLTPFDFHVLCTLQDANRGLSFADYELKYSMCEEMRRFKKEFYSYSISERVDNEGDFVEK
jgi:hypothetical protein